MAIKKRKSIKHAFSYDGYKEYAIVTKKAEEKTKNATKGFLNKINIFKKKEAPPKLSDFIIRGGPVKGTDAQISELLPNISSNQLTPQMAKQVEKYWMPEGGLSVYDHKEKIPLTAAVAAKRHIDDKRWMPQYYQNPMQGYDYLVYESLLKNTIMGPLAWSLVKFIIGTGFAPALELRNPSGDPKKDADLIKKHEYIINNLKYIDRCISEKSDEEGVDISFKMKMTNLIHNMLTFNRSCAVYQYDKENPIKLNPLGPQSEIDGKPKTAKEKKKNSKGVKAYPNIPTGLVDFHPRDIGIVKISPTSKKMVSVQINQIQGMVDYDEMIYMWNSQHAAPIHNAKYYGGSILMPMIEPARLIRTQVSSILPAVSENMAGGLYHIFVEPEGGTEAQRILEYQSITEAAEFGTANVFMLAPDRVKYENVNFDPKIGDLITMFDTQIKYIIACFNLPQIGSYDEAAANHACYSADTQTLTENGWKYYWEIIHGEKIATFNPENENIEFHKPIGGLYLYDYEGDMVSFKSTRQDILVTPNHKMWVHNSSGWKKRDAESLIDLKKVEFRAHGNYYHEEIKLLELEPVEYPLCHNRPQLQVQTIQMDVWLEFLGYYIAEGTKSNTPSRYHVALVQRKGDSADKIQKCLDVLPFKFGSYDDREIYTRWQKDNKQLHKALELTGGTHLTKQIPHWILEKCSSKQLRILFDALMLGDGTVDKRENRTNMSYSTTSPQLADDVQELAMKLGYFARIKKQIDKRENRNILFRVQISKPSQLHVSKPKFEKYKGKVYCFEVPNHLFITRRNGQPAIQGNTAVEKIQLTISTAINPMREWIGEDFGRQWYNRNFLEIYREDYPEIVDLFRIKVDFEDLQVETLKERAETIMEMKDAGINIDIEKVEELMQIEGLKDHIEEQDPNEIPKGPEKFQVKEKGGGKFSVKSS